MLAVNWLRCVYEGGGGRRREEAGKGEADAVE